MGIVSPDHEQTGELGRRSGSNSNRLTPPPRFARVGALDSASSASDLDGPSTTIGSGWAFREEQEIDANLKILSGDVACTTDDRTLLAEFSANLYDTDAIKKLPRRQKSVGRRNAWNYRHLRAA